VRVLTDAAGNVTDGYAYDAFGNLIHEIGDMSNDYLYGGEQRDLEVKLYNLRARNMNPFSGRFVTQDIYPADLSFPPTIHRYIYAANMPTNLIDPTGNFFLAFTEIGLLNSIVTWQILLSEHKSTIVNGQILLGAVTLGLRPGMALRNLAIDTIIEHDDDPVRINNAIDMINIANRIIETTAIEINKLKDAWGKVDKCLHLVKFALSIKSATRHIFSVDHIIKVDRLVKISRKVSVDWAMYVDDVQLTLATRQVSTLNVLFGRERGIEISLKDAEKIAIDLLKEGSKHGGLREGAASVADACF
jgi:RHS repeat-associated protein